MIPLWLTRMVVLALATGLALGCKKEDSPPADATNPPVGTVDDTAGFYLHYRTSEKYTYNMHRGDTTFTTDCTAVAGEDITCYLEAEELDLYFNGASLQYNVPSTMCAYVVFAPYWYVPYQVGTGPTQVTQDTDKNGVVGIDTNSDGTIDTNSADTDVPADGVLETSNSVCPFDYTADFGPNCCGGSYRLRTRAYDASAETPGYSAAVTSFGVPWGGTLSSCIAGPAVDTQLPDKTGQPRPDLMYVDGSGINKEYTIASPVSKERAANIYAANFFIPTEHGGATSEPPALTDVAFGNIGVFPNPYYQLICYDRAEEIKSRIKLFIREWNTSAAFAARATSPANHSLTLPLEASPVSGVPINDRYDWLDYTTDTINFPTQFPGGYQ